MAKLDNFWIIAFSGLNCLRLVVAFLTGVKYHVNAFNFALMTILLFFKSKKFLKSLDDKIDMIILVSFFICTILDTVTIEGGNYVF